MLFTDGLKNCMFCNEILLYYKTEKTMTRKTEWILKIGKRNPDIKEYTSIYMNYGFVGKTLPRKENSGYGESESD